MENSSGFWKWIGAAALVVVLGVGLGYYLSGPQKGTKEVAAQPTVDNSVPPSPLATDPGAHPPPPIGQYTAKGAPDIQIQEQDPSKVKPKAATVAPPTAPDKPAAPPPPPTDQSTLPTENPTPLATTPSTDNSAPAPAPATPVAPTVPAPEPQPAQVAPPAPVAVTPPPDNSPVYHVLVGTTFSSEKNARIFAADLRHRGFMAMTASVSSDSGIVYKVQVGAYHNRLSAEEAASQLQQSGYPAYIATDR